MQPSRPPRRKPLMQSIASINARVQEFGSVMPWLNNWRFWRSRVGQKPVRYFLITLAAMGIVILGLGRSPAMASTARHYDELEFSPLPAVEIPEYTYFELDNGLAVYLIEDHELPLVNGTAMFRTGSRFEPADQVGLAGITGETMRSGGTITHPADELNQILEQRAASVETNIEATIGTANFNVLSEDLNEIFGLFAEVLQEPAFPQDKIDLAKAQRAGMIARRNDDPEEIAGREFNKLIYGAQSPYARTIEYTTLDSISRDDIVQFYQQSFAPDQMILGVVGDFETDAMRSLIEREFGSWQSTQANATEMLPEVAQANKGGVFLVDQPQLTQSHILIGHLGGELRNPDHAALTVMNEVLNGLGGRLVNEVRSRQGLAYVVYAVWSPRYDYPGTFVGGGQTQTPNTVPFVQSMLAELEKIRTAPITDVELTRAKDSVLNAFVFNFQTPTQMLLRIMRYKYYGYPEDFIFQYQQKVADTTIEEVQNVAETYLKPSEIVTLVVGNGAELKPSLAALDPEVQVTTLDISIPQPQS